jgi:nucleotide-binding universal stress UspA family protein
MPFKHVLVATDCGECSDAAVKYGLEMANRDGAALTLVHAFELPYGCAAPFADEVLRAVQDAARAEFAKVLEPVRASVPTASGVLREGRPWEQVLAVAREQGADLIVVGSHGRHGLPRAVLGSVAEKVVRLSPVPVLTVHGAPPA